MTEAQLRIDGMQALNDRLGIVEAERFISVLLREKFDYTEWRQVLWGNITLDKIWELGQERNQETIM
jgi:hypothetical protein